MSHTIDVTCDIPRLGLRKGDALDAPEWSPQCSCGIPAAELVEPTVAGEFEWRCSSGGHSGGHASIDAIAELAPLRAPDRSTPVGIIEIARHLGVQRATVDQWLVRKLLPPPRWAVGGRPAWAWEDIAGWAERTGRTAR